MGRDYDANDDGDGVGGIPKERGWSGDDDGVGGINPREVVMVLSPEYGRKKRKMKVVWGAAKRREKECLFGYEKRRERGSIYVFL